MTLLLPYPLVNGHRYSFVSIEAIFHGIPCIGFTAINYKPSLKAAMVYGSRPQALGRTRGKVEITFDFEMYRLEFEILKATLGTPFLGFGETPFDVSVSYSELPTQPVVTDIIRSARIEEVDLSNADGTDPSKVKCTCSAMDLLLANVSIAGPLKPAGV